METTQLEVVRLGQPVSNVWLLPVTEHGPVLVDSGFPLLWPAIVAGLRRHGLGPRDLAGAILTHRHCDHAGNGAHLDRLAVPVFAGRLDATVLAGRRRRPRIADGERLGAMMCFVENNYPRRHFEPRPLDAGDRVMGFEVLGVPGHTPGSIFLWHEASGTLFTGDALLNAVPPLTYEIGLTLPYRSFCDDYPRALASLAEVLRRSLPVRRLCPGHGPLREGAIQESLAHLMRAETESPPLAKGLRGAP